MDKTLRVLGIVAVVGLLAAILVFLIVISRSGVHIEYTGSVRIIGMPEEIGLRFDEPVTLTMPDGVTLSATVSGSQSTPVAVAFANAVCPSCGAALLPTRYDVLSGRITWGCPQCGYAAP